MQPWLTYIQIRFLSALQVRQRLWAIQIGILSVEWLRRRGWIRHIICTTKSPYPATSMANRGVEIQVANLPRAFEKSKFYFKHFLIWFTFGDFMSYTFAFTISGVQGIFATQFDVSISSLYEFSLQLNLRCTVKGALVGCCYLSIGYILPRTISRQ